MDKWIRIGQEQIFVAALFIIVKKNGNRKYLGDRYIILHHNNHDGELYISMGKIPTIFE